MSWRLKLALVAVMVGALLGGPCAAEEGGQQTDNQQTENPPKKDEPSGDRRGGQQDEKKKKDQKPDIDLSKPKELQKQFSNLLKKHLEVTEDEDGQDQEEDVPLRVKTAEGKNVAVKSYVLGRPNDSGEPPVIKAVVVKGPGDTSKAEEAAEAKLKDGEIVLVLDVPGTTDLKTALQVAQGLQTAARQGGGDDVGLSMAVSSEHLRPFMDSLLKGEFELPKGLGMVAIVGGPTQTGGPSPFASQLAGMGVPANHFGSMDKAFASLSAGPGNKPELPKGFDGVMRKVGLGTTEPAPRTKPSLGSGTPRSMPDTDDGGVRLGGPKKLAQAPGGVSNTMRDALAPNQLPVHPKTVLPPLQPPPVPPKDPKSQPVGGPKAQPQAAKGVTERKAADKEAQAAPAPKAPKSLQGPSDRLGQLGIKGEFVKVGGDVWQWRSTREDGPFANQVIMGDEKAVTGSLQGMVKSVETYMGLSSTLGRAQQAGLLQDAKLGQSPTGKWTKLEGPSGAQEFQSSEELGAYLKSLSEAKAGKAVEQSSVMQDSQLKDLLGRANKDSRPPVSVIPAGKDPKTGQSQYTVVSHGGDSVTTTTYDGLVQQLKGMAPPSGQAGPAPKVPQSMQKLADKLGQYGIKGQFVKEGDAWQWRRDADNQGGPLPIQGVGGDEKAVAGSLQSMIDSIETYRGLQGTLGEMQKSGLLQGSHLGQSPTGKWTKLEGPFGAQEFQSSEELGAYLKSMAAAKSGQAQEPSKYSSLGTQDSQLKDLLGRAQKYSQSPVSVIPAGKDPKTGQSLYTTVSHDGNSVTTTDYAGLVDGLKRMAPPPGQAGPAPKAPESMQKLADKLGQYGIKGQFVKNGDAWEWRRDADNQGGPLPIRGVAGDEKSVAGSLQGMIDSIETYRGLQGTLGEMQKAGLLQGSHLGQSPTGKWTKLEGPFGAQEFQSSEELGTYLKSLAVAKAGKAVEQDSVMQDSQLKGLLGQVNKNSQSPVSVIPAGKDPKTGESLYTMVRNGQPQTTDYQGLVQRLKGMSTIPEQMGRSLEDFNKGVPEARQAAIVPAGKNEKNEDLFTLTSQEYGKTVTGTQKQITDFMQRQTRMLETLRTKLDFSKESTRRQLSGAGVEVDGKDFGLSGKFMIKAISNGGLENLGSDAKHAVTFLNIPGDGRDNNVGSWSGLTKIVADQGRKLGDKDFGIVMTYIPRGTRTEASSAVGENLLDSMRTVNRAMGTPYDRKNIIIGHSGAGRELVNIALFLDRGSPAAQAHADTLHKFIDSEAFSSYIGNVRGGDAAVKGMFEKYDWIKGDFYHGPRGEGGTRLRYDYMRRWQNGLAQQFGGSGVGVGESAKIGDRFRFFGRWPSEGGTAQGSMPELSHRTTLDAGWAHALDGFDPDAAAKLGRFFDGGGQIGQVTPPLQRQAPPKEFPAGQVPLPPTAHIGQGSDVGPNGRPLQKGVKYYPVTGMRGVSGFYEATFKSSPDATEETAVVHVIEHLHGMSGGAAAYSGGQDPKNDQSPLLDKAQLALAKKLSEESGKPVIIKARYLQANTAPYKDLSKPDNWHAYKNDKTGEAGLELVLHKMASTYGPDEASYFSGAYSAATSKNNAIVNGLDGKLSPQSLQNNRKFLEALSKSHPDEQTREASQKILDRLGELQKSGKLPKQDQQLSDSLKQLMGRYASNYLDGATQYRADAMYSDLDIGADKRLAEKLGEMGVRMNLKYAVNPDHPGKGYRPMDKLSSLGRELFNKEDLPAKLQAAEKDVERLRRQGASPEQIQERLRRDGITELKPWDDPKAGQGRLNITRQKGSVTVDAFLVKGHNDAFHGRASAGASAGDAILQAFKGGKAGNLGAVYDGSGGAETIPAPKPVQMPSGAPLPDFAFKPRAPSAQGGSGAPAPARPSAGAPLSDLPKEEQDRVIGKLAQDLRMPEEELRKHLANLSASTKDQQIGRQVEKYKSKLSPETLALLEKYHFAKALETLPATQPILTARIQLPSDTGMKPGLVVGWTRDGVKVFEIPSSGNDPGANRAPRGTDGKVFWTNMEKPGQPAGRTGVRPGQSYRDPWINHNEYQDDMMLKYLGKDPKTGEEKYTLGHNGVYDQHPGFTSAGCTTFSDRHFPSYSKLWAANIDATKIFDGQGNLLGKTAGFYYGAPKHDTAAMQQYLGSRFDGAGSPIASQLPVKEGPAAGSQVLHGSSVRPPVQGGPAAPRAGEPVYPDESAFKAVDKPKTREFTVDAGEGSRTYQETVRTLKGRVPYHIVTVAPKDSPNASVKSVNFLFHGAASDNLVSSTAKERAEVLKSMGKDEAALFVYPQSSGRHWPEFSQSYVEGKGEKAREFIDLFYHLTRDPANQGAFASVMPLSAGGIPAGDMLAAMVTKYGSDPTVTDFVNNHFRMFMDGDSMAEKRQVDLYAKAVKMFDDLGLPVTWRFTHSINGAETDFGNFSARDLHQSLLKKAIDDGAEVVSAEDRRGGAVTKPGSILSERGSQAELKMPGGSSLTFDSDSSHYGAWKNSISSSLMEAGKRVAETGVPGMDLARKMTDEFLGRLRGGKTTELGDLGGQSNVSEVVPAPKPVAGRLPDLSQFVPQAPPASVHRMSGAQLADAGEAGPAPKAGPRKNAEDYPGAGQPNVLPQQPPVAPEVGTSQPASKVPGTAAPQPRRPAAKAQPQSKPQPKAQAPKARQLRQARPKDDEDWDVGDPDPDFSGQDSEETEAPKDYKPTQMYWNPRADSRKEGDGWQDFYKEFRGMMH